VRPPHYQANWTGSELAAAALPLRSTHGAALLKAFSAKDGPPLRRPEGHRRFFATLRAIGFCFGAHRGGVAPSSATAFGPLGFASLAALGLVLEALVCKKHLFARSKNKFGAAFRTLQDLVVIFH
jgi:hypothetical protein